nr:GlsB/YeaQ/YmgE family stress response membrane protein [Bradyrhizobium sp. KB893862 SZCCT0404]
MEIAWVIIVGGIAGVIAKLIMLGEPEPRGFILITTFGITGGVVAAYLGPTVGWDGFGVGVIVGAVFLLCLYRFVRGQRRA